MQGVLMSVLEIAKPLEQSFCPSPSPPITHGDNGDDLKVFVYVQPKKDMQTLFTYAAMLSRIPTITAPVAYGQIGEADAVLRGH